MRRSNRRSGFTLIEMMVVVAIIGVVSAMVVTTFGRQKPRMKLSGAATEFHALLHGARQNALASGHTTVVMVFPTFELPGRTGRGRIVVYEDGDGTFFNPAANPRFTTYDPATPQASGPYVYDPSNPTAPRAQVLEIMDLSREVAVGPRDGFGIPWMAAPFDRVPMNLACTFCVGDRGAIAFSNSGQASFWPVPAAMVYGGSVSFYNPSDDRPAASEIAAIVPEIRTIAVVATTGAIRALRKP